LIVTHPEVTAERFQQFLHWLSPDPERAALRYNEIHAALRQTLAYRGCTEPQHWVDVAFDRVIRKIQSVAPGYEGDPVLYLRAVARKVFLEYTRSRRRFPQGPAVEPRAAEPREPAEERWERRLQCLERCLEELAPEERELILLYYQGERSGKIARRRQLASDASLSRDALRKRSQRIRARVKRQLLARMSEESH
jgi:RNA polymerase sigma factor (sigma-70 family)